MPRSRMRLFFAVVILAISLVILAWGFLPGVRIIHRQTIQPTEMQLPTPSGFILLDNPLVDRGDHVMWVVAFRAQAAFGI